MWLLRTIGPLRNVPRGTRTRPPPAADAASTAVAKAWVFLRLPSPTAPNAVMSQIARASAMIDIPLQQDPHRPNVSAVHDYDGVDDQPQRRCQCFAENQSDEQRLGALKQARPAELHDQHLRQPPEKDAEPRVAHERAVARDEADRQQRPARPAQ